MVCVTVYSKVAGKEIHLVGCLAVAKVSQKGERSVERLKNGSVGHLVSWRAA